MKIRLFKNLNKYKNIFKKDCNGREINIYKLNSCLLTGHTLFYPNTLLKTKIN